MDNLLHKLLDKRQIKDLNVLSPEEKQTYDNWQKVLSEGEISVDKIKEFCDNQIKAIQNQWKNLDNPTQKNERLIILHSVYSTLLNLMNSPKNDKENLEKYLNQLIES